MLSTSTPFRSPHPAQLLVSDGAPKVVLVVEDEPSVRRWIRLHLEASGYTVLVASHVQAAVAVLKSTTPDIVCVDLVLPRESGYDLCEFMRKSETYSQIPIIAMSSRSSPVERAHAAEAGATRYLLKPSELERLATEVGALLVDVDLLARANRGV